MKRRAFIRRMAMAVVAHGLLSWELEIGEYPGLLQLQRDMAQFKNPPFKEVARVMRMEANSYGDSERHFVPIPMEPT